MSKKYVRVRSYKKSDGTRVRGHTRRKRPESGDMSVVGTPTKIQSNMHHQLIAISDRMASIWARKHGLKLEETKKDLEHRMRKYGELPHDVYEQHLREL